MVHSDIPENSRENERGVMPSQRIVTHENRRRIWKAQQAGQGLRMVMSVDNVGRTIDLPDITADRDDVIADFLRHRA
jgi:hypothetical protein